MPLMPTVGSFLPSPSYVNAQNSPFSTGAGDPVTQLASYVGGGLYPGRAFQLSDAEAAVLDINAATAVTLYGGIYQWVQMDSGASSFLQGQVLFWQQAKLSSPYIVTNSATGNEPLIAGVYVNPSTNPVTAGNWFLMFVGPGRVKVLCKSSFTGTAAGQDTMIQTAAANTADDITGVAAPTTAEVIRILGVSESLPVAGQLATIQWTRYFTRA